MKDKRKSFYDPNPTEEEKKLVIGIIWTINRLDLWWRPKDLNRLANDKREASNSNS